MSEKSNRKKIGTTTFHSAHNYGAMLQAYALLKALESKNDVEIVNYYNYNLYKHYNIIRPLSKNPIKSIKRLIDDILNYKTKRIRYNSFENFIENKYNLSSRYGTEAEIKKIDNSYNVLITGSDQVWNPGIVGELSDIYTLNFGNENIKRISYAASVGDASQIAKNKEVFKNKISKIDYISVRENDAKEELSKIIDKPIEVVLDPTLLLTRNEWENEVASLDAEQEKYILAYVVEPDEEYVKIVNDLSEKTGLKVIHFGLKNPGYKNVLKSAYTEGPPEFVNYIKNAEYVVATSFHATVFSIIFNRKFFIIPHKKTGARVTNILDMLGIEGRTFYSYEEFKDVDYDFQTNWEKVDQNLSIEREKSINWLNNAINSEKGKNNV